MISITPNLRQRYHSLKRFVTTHATASRKHTTCHSPRHRTVPVLWPAIGHVAKQVHANCIQVRCAYANASLRYCTSQCPLPAHRRSYSGWYLYQATDVLERPVRRHVPGILQHVAAGRRIGRPAPDVYNAVVAAPAVAAVEVGGAAVLIELVGASAACALAGREELRARREATAIAADAIRIVTAVWLHGHDAACTRGHCLGT